MFLLGRSKQAMCRVGQLFFQGRSVVSVFLLDFSEDLCWSLQYRQSGIGRASQRQPE